MNINEREECIEIRNNNKRYSFFMCYVHGIILISFQLVMTIVDDIQTVEFFHHHNVFAVDQASFAWYMFSVNFSPICPTQHE